MDTRSMPWETFGPPSGRIFARKVLQRDADGRPSAMIAYLPRGMPLMEAPHRHYHRTVVEYNLTLWGELPHWEYTGAEQQHGDLVVFKEGYYMERQPGIEGLHGREVGRHSRTGWVGLHVQTGSGNWYGDENFEEETLSPEYEPGWQPSPELREVVPAAGSPIVMETPVLRILDTRALDWEDGRKALSEGVELRWVDPGERYETDACVFVVRGSVGEAAEGWFAEGLAGEGGIAGAVLYTWKLSAA